MYGKHTPVAVGLQTTGATLRPEKHNEQTGLEFRNMSTLWTYRKNVSMFCHFIDMFHFR